jgi:hypothetical protein
MRIHSFIRLAGFTALVTSAAGCGSTGFLSSTSVTTNTAAPPLFTPAAGSYAGTQSVSITDATPGNVIYYTVDGTAPTNNSPVYTTPISVAANMTINAVASAPGYTSSNIVSGAFQILEQQAAAPLFSPSAGSFATPQTLTMTDSTAGAAIYYTTDGTVPTSSSQLYSAPINVSSTTAFTAIAIAPGYATSSATSGNYQIALPLTSTPTFSPLPGSYTSGQSVTLASATAGAKMYYTTDGSTPTTNSTLYGAPIKVTASETISALAIATGLANSTVAQGTYTITTPQLSAPIFTPSAGTYSNTQTVSIADANGHAAIYYTTDGSAPTTSSTPYSGPIPVNSTYTITAMATLKGYSNSAASASTYTISNATAAYTFKNVQIVGGGFVDGILMHPAQQGLMYARTDVGGAYRWSSSQQQWIPLLDSLTRDESNYMGVESMALDPSDPNKLYLAVGSYADSFGTDGAMLVSNDQGNTFTTVPLTFKLGSNDDGRFAGERLSVDPNLGSHLYFGSRLNGLWESLDSGSTWTQSATFPVQGEPSANPSSTGGVIFEDFIASTGASGSATPTLYVGVDDSTVPALYITTDGGVTWNSVQGQPTGLFLNRAEFGPDGNLYLSYSNALGPEGASGGSLWRYTPPVTSGATGTWANITPSPSFQSNAGTYGFGSIAVDPEKPGVIMATTLDLYYPHDDVFRSLDGGNSWIDLGGNQVRTDALSPWLSFGAATPGVGNWLVALAIDPYNSDHVLYGTGQTIWQTTDATAADATQTTAGKTTAGVVPTNWSVGAQGLEETVIRALISPPAGAPLLSGMRDIGGFTHTVLDASPAMGTDANPLTVDTTSLDFAQAQPSTIVRVGDGGGTQFGAYSTDYGNTWTPFANQAGSTSGGGSVALSADAKTVVWAPEDAGLSYSTNYGSTWTACAGAPGEQGIVSDRINASKFYVYDSTAGTLYRSVNGAANFTVITANLAIDSVLRASYAAEGDLWLATPGGLFHSTDSGSTFSQVAGISAAYDVAFGKAANNASYPSVYLYGEIGGVQGIFLSTDEGATWTQVTDPQHQYGYIDVIAADSNVFGRVYLGTSGRGIIYTDVTH